MILVADHRPEVCEAFAAAMTREGYSTVTFPAHDMLKWLQSVSESDFLAVEGVLLGDCEGRELVAQKLRRLGKVPIIALSEASGLDATLRLFAAGVDDVVRKPVHAREIIARLSAIWRRESTSKEALWSEDGLVVYGYGRDLEIAGQTVKFPRRELRILEYLAVCKNRRVTREQIFNAVYGILDEEVEESVVESHISKLRKKLRSYLGYDPINTQRFLGYQLTRRAAMAA
ncbi:MAG: response regulator transcription factor [Aestuariivirga sp.]